DLLITKPIRRPTPMPTCATTLRHVCRERVSIEDNCLTAALSCPSKTLKMAHGWPKDFDDDESSGLRNLRSTGLDVGDVVGALPSSRGVLGAGALAAPWWII